MLFVSKSNYSPVTTSFDIPWSNIEELIHSVHVKNRKGVRPTAGAAYKGMNAKRAGGICFELDKWRMTWNRYYVASMNVTDNQVTFVMRPTPSMMKKLGY